MRVLLDRSFTGDQFGQRSLRAEVMRFELLQFLF